MSFWNVFPYGLSSWRSPEHLSRLTLSITCLWKLSLISQSPRKSATPSNSISVYLNYDMQLINILVCGLFDPTRVVSKHGDHAWGSEATINSLKLSIKFVCKIIFASSWGEILSILHNLERVRSQYPGWWYSFFLFFFLFLAALGLCRCVRAFSGCGECGLLFIAVRGLLIAVASLVAEHRL